ncbi:hypothetical protein N9W84_00105 [bacterium]|nr:hypothetical protein [bacterium]
MTTKIILNKIDGVDKGMVNLKPEDLSSRISFKKWISENFEDYKVKEIPEEHLLPLLSHLKRLYRSQNLTSNSRDVFSENIKKLSEALKSNEKAK